MLIFFLKNWWQEGLGTKSIFSKPKYVYVLTYQISTSSIILTSFRLGGGGGLLSTPPPPQSQNRAPKSPPRLGLNSSKNEYLVKNASIWHWKNQV